MQLSLPPSLPVSPDAAIAGSASPGAGLCGQASSDQADVSFDSLLPEANPADEPVTAKVGDEAAEAAASLLAGAFWMAVGPLPLANPPAIDAGDSAVGNATTPSGEPVPDALADSGSENAASAAKPSLFAPRSSRAFAAIATAAARFESKLVPGQGPAHALVTPPAAEAAEADGSTVSPAVKTSGDAVPTSPVAVTGLQTALVAGEFSAQPISPAAADPKVETTPASDEDGIETATVEITPSGTRRPLRAPAATLADRPVSGPKAAAQENIAAASRYTDANASAKNLPEKKDFLNPDQAAVTARTKSVGISVAEQGVSMSPNPSNRPKSAQIAELVPVASVSVEKLPALDASPEASKLTATVHGVLAKVVSAVESLARKEIAGQKAVDLQFRVGDQALALRVELRDGTVHTTFRAQSAELRSALAQEWQAVVQPAAGREIRIADPVFSSSHANGDSAFGSTGQGTPHQRGQASPEAAVFNLAREFTGATKTDPTPTATVSAAPASTSLLNTFA